MQGEAEMKLFKMYKKYMFRPILYKTVTRLSVVAALCLLWERFVSDGRFGIWEAPVLLAGAVLLGWAWVSYLHLDGITIHHPFEGMEPKVKFHATRSIVDFADEKIVAWEDLEPEERSFCSMLSNIILGLPLVLGSVIASMLR